MFIPNEIPRLDSSIISGPVQQAHMVREWHALAGCTPGQWIRGQLPFLQDYEVGGGDDCMHDHRAPHQSDLQRRV